MPAYGTAFSSFWWSLQATAAMWAGPQRQMQVDFKQTQVLVHAVQAHRLWGLSC